MARGHELEARESDWRDLAWAGGAAAAITVLLVIGVGVVWLLGRSATSAPPLAIDQVTPTPRALSFARSTPPAQPETVAADDAAIASAGVEGSPELLSMAVEFTSSASQPAAILKAPGGVAFAALASGSWSASADVLANEGANAVAEPWLELGAVPGTSFAIEADMRVTRLLETVCDQSFGIAAGNLTAGQVYGGGLHFPCTGTAPAARLSDVAVWEDGYNVDPVFAEDVFDPGADWHTYRFEIRDDRLRLIVDGVGVVAGQPPALLSASVSEVEAGLWSQGVGLEVREIAIYPLPG
jgi:hypothetical protein